MCVPPRESQVVMLYAPQQEPAPTTGMGLWVLCVCACVNQGVWGGEEHPVEDQDFLPIRAKRTSTLRHRACIHLPWGCQPALQRLN